jgi:hypothetical protein
VILLVLGFVSIDCFGQSPNNEQRLVGTWIREGTNDTVVFNADGTFSQTQRLMFTGVSYKYGAAENKIGFVYTDRDGKRTYFGDYYVSTDGKTLIILLSDTSSGLQGLYRKKT